VGAGVGLGVGAGDGSGVGLGVGAGDGSEVGLGVGARDGSGVGLGVGLTVGAAVWNETCSKRNFRSVFRNAAAYNTSTDEKRFIRRPLCQEKTHTAYI